VRGRNQTAKPPTKEKADDFALSPQNGAVVLSQRRRWGHRTDGEKFTLRLTRRNGQPRKGRPVRLRKDSTNLLRRGAWARGDLFPSQAATCRLSISTQRAKGWYSCVRPCECGLNHIGRNSMTILKKLAIAAAMIVIASSVAVAQTVPGAPIGKTPSPHKHKHYKMHMRTTPHAHKHMKTQG